MAIKLSKAFDSTSESWLELQNQYDLWQEHLPIDIQNTQKLFSFSANESGAHLTV